MKIIDKYIIKKFLGTFFFILLVIMSLASVFDYAEKLEDFIKADLSFFTIIIEYYIPFIIYYSNLFSSLLIFIAVIFFTSKLAQNTEIIAILSGGVSYKRFLYPYFLAAAFLTLFSLFSNHFLLPKANAKRWNFEETYLKSTFNPRKKDFHREFVKGSVVYFHSFNIRNNWADQFSIETWNKGRLTYVISAKKAYFDTIDNSWELKNYVERFYISDEEEKINQGASFDTIINFKPSDIGQRTEVAGTMITSELIKYIKDERERGNASLSYYEIELAKRTSMPFSIFILVLIGVSISSRKVRGGIGAHLAMGLLIAVAYIFFLQLSSVAAVNSGINIVLASWIPNIVFFLMSIIIYKRAQM